MVFSTFLTKLLVIPPWHTTAAFNTEPKTITTVATAEEKDSPITPILSHTSTNHSTYALNPIFFIHLSHRSPFIAFSEKNPGNIQKCNADMHREVNGLRKPREATFNDEGNPEIPFWKIIIKKFGVDSEVDI